MNNTPEKKAGISLIVFTVLLLFTMALHPAGGSIEHLISITTVIVVTHAIAILSLPFGWIGFYGLTRKIGMENYASMLGLVMLTCSLIAVMLAAATNGLVLPIFVQHYKDATPEAISAIKPIIRYSSAVNHAFDYIYTGLFCGAVMCWSVAILLTRKLPAWIGWVGILLFIGVVAVFIAGIAVNSLLGLRIFIGGIVVWILSVGVTLLFDVKNIVHDQP